MRYPLKIDGAIISVRLVDKGPPVQLELVLLDRDGREMICWPFEVIDKGDYLNCVTNSVEVEVNLEALPF